MSRSRVVDLSNFQQFTAINVLSDPGHIGGPKVVPQTAEIRLQWGTEDGHFAFNVLHGSYSGGFAGTVAQANSIFTALSSGAAWTALAVFLPTTTFLAGVQLRDINSANQALISSTNAGVPGTSASPSLPNEVAEVITLRTALTGAGNRGRIYFPTLATNALGSGNVIAAGAVAALNGWAALLPGALSAQGYTFCLALAARAAYTGSTGTQHPARAAHPQAITSQVVRDNHWDTQRRRGLK